MFQGAPIARLEEARGMVGATVTLTERLRQQRDALTLKLKELTEALEAIESNPEIQRVSEEERIVPFRRGNQYQYEFILTTD